MEEDELLELLVLDEVVTEDESELSDAGSREQPAAKTIIAAIRTAAAFLNLKSFMFFDSFFIKFCFIKEYKGKFMYQI